MRRLLVIAVAVSMALVTAPSALSQPVEDHEDGDGWRAGYWNTNYEPNVPGYDADEDGTIEVPFDSDETKMWQTANQDREDKIYFDAIPGYQSFPFVPWPQTSDDQPRQQLQQYTVAELGFWRDCNGDGYVGSAVTGAQSYSIDQLREESAMNGHDWQDTCPMGDRDGNTDQHVDLLYNDGIQVRELVPIGYQDRDAESGSEVQKAADDAALCPDRSGDETEAGSQRSGTERTEVGDGVLQGGNNVACYHSGTDFFVQDDFVKVGWHLESPDEGESGTSSILPPPDGITTDSNGFFWYVDNQNLGKVSETFPGLWPTKYNHENGGYDDNSEYQDDPHDPRAPNQCEQHRDPTGASGGSTGVAAADNAEQFAAENGEPTEYPDRATAWASDFTDLRKSRDTKLVTCSPVPNMQYIDVDNDDTTEMDRFAWPLHIAEDRYSNEESGDEDPKPVTDPFKCEDGGPGGVEGTGIQGDVSSWDDEDDADPIADSGEPYKYYGPNHDGASVYPVVDRAVEMAAAHAGTSSCDQSYDGDNLETYDAGGAEPGGPRDEMGYEMSYDSGECINPAKSPGVDQADTPVCHNLDFQSIDTEMGRKADYSYWWGTNFIDVPDEPPDFWAGRTFSHTAYADVSFGVVEDDADGCDYAFDPAGDDGYASGSSDCFPQTSNPLADTDGDGQPDGDNRGGIFDAGPLDPANRDHVSGWGDYLPAGQDDAHVFADLHCTTGQISPLDVADGGSDDFGAASSDAPFNMRNCDRQQWMDTENIDCNLTSGDNPTAELSCYLNWKPGDRYDLWDVTCMDNAMREPVGDAIQENIGNRDCDTQQQPS